MDIGIIGCGHMGEAIAKRLALKNNLFLYDRNEEKTKALAKEGVGTSCDHLQQVVQGRDLILLAIKPQDLTALAKTMQDMVRENQILVSILAGTELKVLERLFPKSTCIRMMPNLPAIYGEGVIGVSSHQDLRRETKESLLLLFQEIGKVYWIPEAKMDALTALSGSGPAFFYAMIEAMVDAGVSMGFSAHESLSLVEKMLSGSLTLLRESKKHPGELKWSIASPQGTTIAGIRKLEQLALRGSIIDTFHAAFERSKELAASKD